jgi:formyl-CoA transferase
MSENESRNRPRFAGPMAGLRVLDMTTMFSGAFGATLLADFGADVIKVELPGTGDSVRGMSPAADGVPLPWTTLARNKRTITLDVRKPAGRDLLLRLLPNCDLLFENFRPGTLDRWDLSYETLKQANPRIVVVRVSGYGQTGPYAEKAGFGTPATAFSGYTYVSGFPDRAPTNQPMPLADYVTGIFAALAAVMAVYHRAVNDDEEGQEVDLALYESLFRLIETYVPTYHKLGVVPERRGHQMDTASPVGTYETRDGKWLVMTASTQRTWERCAEVIGRTELIHDPRFLTNEDRVRHFAALDEIIRPWYAERGRDEALAEMDAAGVPVSPINSIADLFEDEHIQARGNIIEVEHPVLGSVKMPGLIPKFSRTPGEVRHPGSLTPGEHNDEIYGDLLALDHEQLTRLREDGVI